MRADVCRELLIHLDKGELQCGHAPKPVQKWLEKIKLPTDFLRFMQWYWPQQDGQLAHLTILSSSSIKSDDSAELLASAGFLLIGAAPNGDSLVVDFGKRACVPGFITHEEWDQESKPREFFEPIARSFESLLYRLAEGRYVPTDYYAAKPFNVFLREEEKA